MSQVTPGLKVHRAEEPEGASLALPKAEGSVKQELKPESFCPPQS